MTINYRKLVEDTDFDLHDLLWELAYGKVSRGRAESPPAVTIRKEKAVLLDFQCKREPDPIDREGELVIRYLKVEKQ